jgi:hypothetical protein
MKASQIKPGDVLTTPKGSWMVREVKNLPDYDHIGVKFAAGRTDPGDWYKIPRDAGPGHLPGAGPRAGGGIVTSPEALYEEALREITRRGNEIEEFKAAEVHACQQRDHLRVERDDLLDTLEDVINQACWIDGGGLDSSALSAYADGMRLLAKHNRLVIEREYGRRVIGHWPTKRDTAPIGEEDAG